MTVSKAASSLWMLLQLLWINMYYLEIYYEQELTVHDCKIVWGKAAMFFSLPLLLTKHHLFKWLTEGCFAYWMLSRKHGKPHSFDLSN